MYKHLLVPIDGTPLAAATVEQAVAYARAGAARLTFLHARADFAATGDGALLHAMSPQAFDDAAAGNARSLVAKAEAAARGAGVACSSRVVTSDRPHEAILEAAAAAGCDLIFMASHGRRGLKGALLGSVTRKVLERATLPVLVAAVQSNLALHTDEQRALAILRDEHRSLDAVLHALLGLVGEGEREPDRALLHAMLVYIERFPERLHHPKEDGWLFARLRACTSECDALIGELEQQHRAGAARVAEMRRCLQGGDMPAFGAHLRDFARLQREHMGAEETLVLPAASRHLRSDDWRDIAQAFGANGDPRFGTGESFEALASRLLELASRAD
jgi:nucleotide-binding universal stress UspA family protein/hemerythrin-like domain-containing protein